MEQELPTKLQLASRLDVSGLMCRRGLGKVNERKLFRGSAKNGGAPCSIKSDLTTEQDVSREPQEMDQSFVTGSSKSWCSRLKSVRSLECADCDSTNVVRITLLVSLGTDGESC